MVETLGADAEQGERLRGQLHTEVELRLHTAGIRVLTEQELWATPGIPHLSVAVSTLSTSGWYACAITVELKQLVRLERAPVVRAVAPTWRSSSDGIVSATDLGQVREGVARAVDKFIAAYRAANPQ